MTLAGTDLSRHTDKLILLTKGCCYVYVCMPAAHTHAAELWKCLWLLTLATLETERESSALLNEHQSISRFKVRSSIDKGREMSLLFISLNVSLMCSLGQFSISALSDLKPLISALFLQPQTERTEQTDGPFNINKLGHQSSCLLYSWPGMLMLWQQPL
jgi:hypothetical protein